MMLSRSSTFSWRTWCVAAVAFNVVLWASVFAVAHAASRIFHGA